MNIRWTSIIFIGSIIFTLSACNRHNPVTSATYTVAVTNEPTVTPPAPTETPYPPTETPIPFVAIVNGEGITLNEFTEELTRFQATIPITGTNLASDPGAIVLDELIDQTLLAQSAIQNGLVVDDTMLQSKINSLETQLGGSQALETWISTHDYSREDFEQALKRAIGAAWMRDQIIAAVPETADQVHVRQILLPSKGQADEVYASLQTGASFMELATLYDPATGGDLGWFPRGYLDELAIEEAAFALQPEQYSPVVETEIGYHILYLVERDENHNLQPDARKVLQINALQEWMGEHRNQSEIQILLP